MIALWYGEDSPREAYQVKYYSKFSSTEPLAWLKVLLLSSYSRYWQRDGSMGMRFVSLTNFFSSSLILDRP